jgi:hypothetical protein
MRKYEKIKAIKKRLSKPSDFSIRTCEEQNRGRASVWLAPGEIEPEPMMLIGKEDEDIEGKRDADPNAAQYQGFLERYCATLPVEYPQIQRHQEEYEKNERHPQPHQEPFGSEDPNCRCRASFRARHAILTGSAAPRIDGGQFGKEMPGTLGAKTYRQPRGHPLG